MVKAEASSQTDRKTGHHLKCSPEPFNKIHFTVSVRENLTIVNIKLLYEVITEVVCNSAIERKVIARTAEHHKNHSLL